MGKRGDKRGHVKPSIVIPSILNKRNIIFLLVVLLLVILIVYLVIRTWPIMKERLADDDKDGVKNYKDKCPSTTGGVSVDEYGCEIKISEQKESLELIGEEKKSDTEGIICSEDDGGNDIWEEGNCKDKTGEKKDYCKEDFGTNLFEYTCFGVVCKRNSIDCGDYNALCYGGRCIDRNKDTDKDGYPDLDEYKEDTDPENPGDYPGNVNLTIQSDCNSLCLSLGYIRGEGPFDSFSKCDSYEVGKYLSGNSGDICCCKDCGLWCKSSGWNYGTVTTKSNCNTYPTNYYDDSLGCCCHMEIGAQETDTDKDGIPDSIDTDDDNDGYTDSEEQQKGTNPLNPNDYPGKVSTRTCTDSDGGDNIYVKGTVTGLNPEPYSFTDSCSDSTYLMENWCVQVYDGYTFGGGVKKCDYGCADGRCKEKPQNPNIGLACSSTAVTPTSQADCSLRTGCQADTYCKFVSNVCFCAWEEDCIDSDFEEGYRYLDIYKHKGYCTEDNEVKNWDVCLDDYRLKEWGCSPTVSCESFEVNCAEWFEDGYCEDGICKSCKDYCPGYAHTYHYIFTGYPTCLEYGNLWCWKNKNNGVKDLTRPNADYDCCCWNCIGE